MISLKGLLGSSEEMHGLILHLLPCYQLNDTNSSCRGEADYLNFMTLYLQINFYVAA